MSSFGGVGLSKGRGFGRGIAALGLQKPVESNVIPASNTPRSKVNDDDWDDTGATSTNNGWAPAASNNSSSGGWAPAQSQSNDNTWGEDSSNNNTWGDSGNSGSNRRGGSSCFKCGKEGHMSRDCPEATNSRSNACFNCGQEGHRSSDCTEPRKPRGGGGGTCFNCGQEGHRSSDCTEPRKPRAGGGGGACFNCGQEGHRSSDCTEPRKPRAGGGGGGGACFNCGQEGHRSSDCTEPRKPRNGGGGGGGTCFNCGQEGHRSSDCTEPKKSRESYKRDGQNHFNPKDSRVRHKNNTRACFKCNEEGHMSRDCPNPDTNKSSRACRKCGEEGHMSRECPTAGNEPQKCFKCQQEGHMSRECPNSDASSTACFRCKEEGHMSRDCPNPDTREGAEGKPKSTYVPPEITSENEIFNVNPAGLNFSKYSAIPVKATGEKCPNHINSFDEANFRPTLNKNIARAKYTTPTPVQKYTIPILCAKRDLMACAQTGSGKTAAFLLPIIDAMFKADDLPGLGTNEPWAVIVSPTRELATQIYQEAVKFSYDSIVKPAIVYGGTAVGVQASRLSKGCHILVATTGRLIQFLNEGKISFSQVHYLVLDEADRLLDMGFKGDIEKLVNHPTMPPKGKRQTLMFSATFPREVQQLATDFLDERYIFLEVGIVGAANADVEQVIYQVGQFDKRQKLMDLLNEFGSDKTLVFVELKRMTDFNASFLSLNDIKATSIHGDREQREREEALNDFKSGRMKVLVATAVAARGLDITGVRHVINFDMPKDIDEYVHRIGRTGRVGNTGRASSFFDPEKDGNLATDLIRILSDAQQNVPPWLEEAARGGGYSGGGGGGNRRFGNRDIRQNQSVTTSSFGGEEENWGVGAPATNASVPQEEDSWD